MTSGRRTSFARFLLTTAMLQLLFVAAKDARSPDRRPSTSPDSVTQARIRGVRRLLAEHMRQADIPGLAVAVSVKGRVIWSEGFGYADLETRAPVTPLTRFRVGSVSKAFTSAALGQLYEHHRIALDAPVQRYVPEFPVKRWPITVREIASHTSGIRHYGSSAEILRTDHVASVIDALSTFARDTLLFEPGTRYEYSSYGYVLLSAVIERAAGIPFLQYMRDSVFARAGMMHTTPDVADSIIPFRSGTYDLRDGRRVRAPFVDNSSKWAAGGFLSTAEDLVRFGEAMLSGTLVSSRTRDTLFAATRLSNGSRTDYGLGWAVHDEARDRVAQHGGNIPGGRAHLVLLPEQGVVFALVMNTSQGVFINDEEARALAGLFAPGDKQERVSPNFVGTYRFDTQVGRDSVGGALLQVYRSAEGDLLGAVTFRNRPLPAPLAVASGDTLRLFEVPNWLEFELVLASGGATGRWRSFSDETWTAMERISRLRLIPYPNERPGEKTPHTADSNGCNPWRRCRI